MQRIVFAGLLVLISGQAFAQEQNAKLSPYYQQQRNTALDNLASCAALVNELQAKIADLEKKVAALSSKKD